MCNDFGLIHTIDQIERAFAGAGLQVGFPGGRPNLEPREDIRPTDPAAIVRSAPGGGIELAPLKWGFQPSRPKAGPVINFRGEGREFDHGRCLIPASHFFEFTGAKPPKAKWKFTRPDGELFCIAGIWRGGEPSWGPSFTMLTVEPGPDVAPIHDRQVVVLEPEHWAGWLDCSIPAARFMKPCAAGALKVEQVRGDGRGQDRLLL